jgi:TetR/AcrR family transcriptional repressor of nem operon
VRPESATKQNLLNAALDLILGHSYGSISVDDICKRAGVQKGSFYHFFPSKSDLAMAALDDYWDNQRRPLMDQAFSVQNPPIKRFMDYCDQVYEIQKKRFENHGRVVGCPYNLVGTELSAEDEQIRRKCQENGDRVCHYFESAIRDGIRDESFHDVDARVKARELYSLIMGILMQARIRNDLEMIKTFKPSMRQLLGLIEEKRSAGRHKSGLFRIATV